MQTTSEKRSLIRRFAPFSDLSDAALESLLEAAQVRHTDVGEIVWREGEPTGVVSLIADGSVKLVTSRRDGPDVILAIHHAEECVGFEALGRETERPTRAVAIEPTLLVELDREQLSSFLETHPQVAEILLAEIVETRCELVERLRKLCTSGAERRLAMVFEELAEEYGHRRTFDNGNEGIWIPLSLSRSDLAELINTRIETAIRLMSTWRNDDLVDTEPDGFALYDPQRIHAIAHGA